MININLNDTVDTENDTLFSYQKNENEDEPFIGQTFCSDEEAYIFYKNYAENRGFAIRKDRTQKKDEKIVRRDFSCHRGRKRPVKMIQVSKDCRNRESSRCECTAHLRIALRRSLEIFPEEWHVTSFVKPHNHKLLSVDEMSFLPYNRIITDEDESKIMLFNEAGLSIRQIIRVMELQKKVPHGDLPFIEKDIRNLFTKFKKIIGPDDAKNLLQDMKVAREENSKFQYAYTIDKEGRLEHLFWCPAQCFDWYNKYGEVVVFDTTYKVNSYDMPCAIFVGVDNYGNTVLFACALLRNETTSAFKWLMKTFITTLRKSPKTIITDQDPWMSEAIASEMPTTKHSFCIWHITTKFSSWFTIILRDEYQNWCQDFYKLYRMNSREEFEHNWPSITTKYNLQSNKHVQGLYQIREFWVPAYLRDYFFGGMTTTGRSESINAFIKRFISSHTSLVTFSKQMDVAIKEIEHKRRYFSMTSKVRPTSLKTKSPLEEQALRILTPYAFKKLQEELQRASQYTLIHTGRNDFILRYFGEDSRKHKVFWDGNIALCSCKNFEFWGIICRHILRVLIQKDCFEIPPFYLPSRWRFNTVESECLVDEVDEQQDVVINLKDVDDILCPPKSKTKGRPRKQRLKGGKELAKKQTKSCSICKQPGHTKPKCPFNDNLKYGTSNNSEQKKQKVSSVDLGLNPIFSLKY